MSSLARLMIGARMIEAKTGLSLEETKYRLAFLLVRRIGALGRWRRWYDIQGRRLVGAVEVVHALVAGRLS